MNGMNSVGGTNGVSGPNASDASSFESQFEDGMVSTAAVLMQFIGADILESVMKDESAVD